MLGDIDESLLEEALELPQKPDEIVLESDGRRKRRSIFTAVTAIAASLAIVAGVVLFRANFGRISTRPNESVSSDISEPDNAPSGIVIPKNFTEDDRELQQILNDIDYGALRLCEVFGYYPERSFSHSDEFVQFLFPQMAQPLTFQLDKYRYFTDYALSTETLSKRLADFFTKEAAEKFLENICKGEIVEVNDDMSDITINIIEGGKFDENGYLVEPPNIVEADGILFRIWDFCGRDFSGFRSTAKVISRTDDEIVFSYIYEFNGELFESKGRLVNENGWKFSWCGDWIF